MDKAELVAQLHALQISRVEIGYDGQGDEGYINEVRIYDLNNVPVVKIDETLSAQLDQFGYDLLEEHHAGWEINEGAFGMITIDVLTGKISNIYNERYESSTEFNEEY